MEDVWAPFDVDMIIAQIINNDFVDLKEAYRVSMDHPIRVKHYGNWSTENGLKSPPHVSLYYRRDDFEGLRLKVGVTEVSFS